MKKVLFSLALVFLFSMGVSAQTGSKEIMPKIGYQTEAERFLIGLEGRYFLTDNIRLAPSVEFLLPKDHLTGLDVNFNAHYVFPFEGGFKAYPLVGLNVMNNRFSWEGESASDTMFGLNLGAGAQYDITENGYLNLEFKYTVKEYTDVAYITLGYGIKF